jgi:hypothetical protein
MRHKYLIFFGFSISGCITSIFLVDFRSLETFTVVYNNLMKYLPDVLKYGRIKPHQNHFKTYWEVI